MVAKVDGVISDLVVLYRTSRLIKALHPQWNQTVDSAKTLLADQEQTCTAEEDVVRDEIGYPLNQYIKTFQSLQQKYRSLSDEDRQFLLQNDHLIREKAALFFKEDVFNRLEEINYLFKTMESDSQESLLKAQESRLAQVYAEHFGVDEVSFLYTLLKRPVPSFETNVNPVLNDKGFSYNEEQLSYMLVNFEYRKIFLNAKYPNDNIEQLCSQNIPLDDTMKLHYYLVRQKELEKIKNKMTAFDLLSLEKLESEAQDIADNIFKNQIESAINHYCGQYVDSVQNNELYNFKLLNNNMELYKNRYGSKALDELPAVKNAKKLWEEQNQISTKKNISTVLSVLQENADMPHLAKEETVARYLMQSQREGNAPVEEWPLSLSNKPDSFARA